MDDVKQNQLHWPPGYRRVENGTWVDHQGAAVTDPVELDRLARLAIPPAWKNVWAAPDGDQRVQARGIDSRGRMQYRYSEAASQEAARNKFAHTLHYAKELPRLRKVVSRHLSGQGEPLSFVQVTALAGRFLDLGLFRVGSDRYVAQNNTYGLTTLLSKHVWVEGDFVHFDFIGKEHLRQQHRLKDKQAARMTRRLLESRPDPDDFLFVANDPMPTRVRAATLNSYIHSITGTAATAKTARTWGATVIAASVIGGARFDSEKKHRDKTLTAFDAASHVLGNTPTMARASYVHPSALTVGESEAVEAAVADASRRKRTDRVERIFTDPALQETVRQGLVDMQG